jgi:hypothetical protein
MTTPPAPPAPPAPTPPAPPAPAPPAPTPPPAPAAGSDAEELAKLRAILDDERKQRKAADDKLAKLERSAMTDQEKAVAEAREQGKAEAADEHAKALAAAEFRAAATGRLVNPDKALARLDLAGLVKDGKPDTAAITAAVDDLAAVPGQPGRVPPGPREPGSPADGDFFRDTMARR